MDMPPSRFVTAWFGMLDVDAHELHSIAAGQGPLIHLHANDEVEILSADALFLGIMPDLMLDEPVSFHLEPGDMFFVASDGFAEAARADKQMFGNDRIIDLLRTAAASRPERSSRPSRGGGCLHRQPTAG